MQDNLRSNLYPNIDLKNEPNAREILQTFDRFFFAFGRFPAINELIIVPDNSSVKSSDVSSTSELYEKFRLDETRGLVCINFFPALNVIRR